VSKLNTSLILAYDFAVSGATTDTDIVSSYATYCFDDQVETLFQTYLASKPDYAPWTSADTLVAVWIGINDVGQPFWDGEAAPIDAVMDRYFGLLQDLYNDGVTNFVLFTIPRKHGFCSKKINNLSD
jgi:phospholipase/lecithinase/hemolysin